MSRIFHITSAQQWDPTDAQYRGDTLATEGFIHCAKPGQLLDVADRLFRGRTDLLLLHIDLGSVVPEIRYENLLGRTELFPHIYGPLNRDAVVAVEPLPPNADGRFSAPADLRSLLT